MGPTGPQGPPGELGDYAWIEDISWPHDEVGPLTLLERLQVRLTSELAERFMESMPRLIQVWLEPHGDPEQGPAPTQILTLHGTPFAEERTVLSWSLSDNLDVLQQAIPFGCRVLIRIHLGVIHDIDDRVYSASTERLLGVPTPHVPGGVFESWFFIGGVGLKR
jgi:hypothetical protein